MFFRRKKLQKRRRSSRQLRPFLGGNTSDKMRINSTVDSSFVVVAQLCPQLRDAPAPACGRSQARACSPYPSPRLHTIAATRKKSPPTTLPPSIRKKHPSHLCGYDNLPDLPPDLHDLAPFARYSTDVHFQSMAPKPSWKTPFTLSFFTHVCV
ncbi:hypothetical protein P4U99_07190 [Brevibacillus agri]|uniref:hypothetical protein n=1 Tax=Brevibacillus agri TaxID=51101 RepID=UPI001EE53FCD|nr:hypothetical protein [Brevibacillus agri]MCG5254624.1 hypothetical protein [Brevibacillus agri]MED1642971.1 hypothetical protein [Brevibacillus agri]MED1656544.1 hypothetical protein [Brevibacillus agri]MED1689561.1 hypothetical protein [Brevibacillus agri]MED1690580.1 hypothetical protein [Brevibacillus agri]